MERTVVADSATQLGADARLDHRSAVHERVQHDRDAVADVLARDILEDAAAAAVQLERHDRFVELRIPSRHGVAQPLAGDEGLAVEEVERAVELSALSLRPRAPDQLGSARQQVDDARKRKVLLHPRDILLRHDELAIPAAAQHERGERL